MVNEIKGCLKLDSNLQGTGWGGVHPVHGENYQIWKRGREYQGSGDEYKAEKGMHYPLSFHIKAVGKNIKKGNGTENMVN